MMTGTEFSLPFPSVPPIVPPPGVRSIPWWFNLILLKRRWWFGWRCLFREARAIRASLRIRIVRDLSDSPWWARCYWLWGSYLLGPRRSYYYRSRGWLLGYQYSFLVGWSLLARALCWRSSDCCSFALVDSLV